MNTSLNREAYMPEPISTRWQRQADRLARYAWYTLLLVLAIGLVGGLISGLIWHPNIDVAPVEESQCTQPPCFSLDLDRIRLRNIPGVLWLPVYLLALLLSLPSLLASLWDFIHRRWAAGGRRFLTFVGLLLFFVGTEVIPHALPTCVVIPWVCEEHPVYGRDIGQWHQLYHMLAGALPMVVLYWFVLRRWHHTFYRERKA